METTEIVIKKITAGDGMWLTPVVGGAGDPVHSKEVYLGAGDVAENWHEVTDAEKNEAERLAIEANRQRVAEILG